MNRSADLTWYLPSSCVVLDADQDLPLSAECLVLKGQGFSRGVRRKLERAGFQEQEYIVAIPNFVHPMFFVPLADKSVVRYFQKNLFHLVRTIPPEYGVSKVFLIWGVRVFRLIPSAVLVFMLRQYAPSFVIIAKKR